MAGGNTVTLTFAGDDRNLSKVLAGLSGKTKTAEQSVRKFGAVSAMAVPALGYTAGAVVGLSGAMGVLPSMAFAGGLALGALAIGTAGFGDAIKNVGDPAKFAESIAKLAPAARETALAVRDLKPQFDGLKTAVQDKLFTGMADQLRTLTGALLPTLQNQLVLTAGSINATGMAFGRWLSMPSTVGDINTALSGSRAFLNGVLAALVPVSAAFLDIGVVAAPYMERMGAAISAAAIRFREFIESARQTGALNEWIGEGLAVFQQLWQVIKNLGMTIVNLGLAFESAGLPTLLEMISLGLLKMSEFIRTNAAVMVPLIVAIGAMVVAAKTVMGLVAIFKTVSGAIAAFRLVFAALNLTMLANPFVLIVVAIGALVAAIIYAWNNCETFRNVVKSVWAGIKAAFAAGVAAVKGLLNWFAGLPGRFSAWFGGAKDRAVSMLGSLLAWVRGLPGRILSALGNLGSLLASSGRNLITGFLNGLKGAWNKVISWASGAMDWLRSFWPFSPAKRGAFSGGGYVTHSGRAMVNDFAASLLAGQGVISSAASQLMASAQMPFSGLGNSVDFGSVSNQTWDALKAAGWKGRAGDSREALYRPANSGIRSGTAAGGSVTHVTVHVAGSIRSDRDIVSLIRDEMDRGGFRGVRS